jgi:hypothetical protein
MFLLTLQLLPSRSSGILKEWCGRRDLHPQSCRNTIPDRARLLISPRPPNGAGEHENAPGFAVCGCGVVALGLCPYPLLTDVESAAVSYSFTTA